MLEEGLALHGQLAPSGVLPLHQRLLERFKQLRQSLGSLSRLRRQQSESIVKLVAQKLKSFANNCSNICFSTPLPPLPIDRRYLGAENHSNRSSNSSGIYGGYSESQILENDDIYTKPMVSPSNKTIRQHSYFYLPVVNLGEY